MTQLKKVIVVATPTSPLLPHTLHELSHQQSLQITVLTRETSISIPLSSHDHGHKHTSQIQHIKTDFSETSLSTHLKNTHTVICHLIGSDIHLTPSLITASTAASVQVFVPSEYGLDTSNSKIRSLLPPYQTRFDIQSQLKSSNLKWTAIYSGLVLEDAMKSDGALGIDCLWGSVVEFSKKESTVALSTYEDIAKAIVKVVTQDAVESEEVWTSSFRATLREIVSVVEKKLDREFDIYEGSIEDAKREAKERMKGGYFDGGVALMGRVAVWDNDVDAWAGWDRCGSASSRQSGWEDEVAKIAVMVRSGESGGGGCGC